jgi:hypothetical protein
VPRGGFFFHDIELPLGVSEPPEKLHFVQQVVSAYNVSSNPGQFRVAPTGEMLHVLPVASLNAEGQLVKRQSLLETRITVPEGRRNAARLLSDVVSAIESVRGVEIGIYGAPTNLLVGLNVEPEVTEDLALNILARELSRSTDVGLSWRLLYSPRRQDYMLTVHTVRRQEK